MKNNIQLIRVFTIAFIIFLAFSCTKESDKTPIVNNQALTEAFTTAAQIGNLKSLVVFHNDSILKEAFYGAGGADIRHDVRSVTKSVISILIGIAIDKGYLTSIDQTLGEFIDPRINTITSDKAAIKIRHLLTMSSGFEWDEMTSVSGYNNWILAPNQVQYLLDKPLATQPGQTFNYNSAALHLLSVILTKSTGMSTHDFAMKYLFEPLEIPEVEWQVDIQGFNNGGAGLKITPHDMVKIGGLVLNHGVYNGNMIVSPDYIDQAIISKISINDSSPFATGYGYCWWTGRSSGVDYVFANGYGGQFITIVPELHLVVVATNQWSGVQSTIANNQWYQTLDLIINKIIPAFND